MTSSNTDGKKFAMNGIKPGFKVNFGNLRLG
jgi:hypothetical protein